MDLGEDDVEYGCSAEMYRFRWSGEHICACEQNFGHDGDHFCEECGRSWNVRTPGLTKVA